MADQFILALDQGTSSSRAIAFDQADNIRSVAQKEFTQHYPHAGWVEHNPEEIWWTQAGVAVEALSKAGIESTNIAAIGFIGKDIENRKRIFRNGGFFHYLVGLFV